MSRGPRDLRDLICVSRLDFRVSDDEGAVSEDDRLHTDWDAVSIGSSGSCDSRNSSAKGNKISPDSGCVPNGDVSLDPELKLDLTLLGSGKKKSKKKKKKVLETDPPKIPFPKARPLPPVRSVSSEIEATQEMLFKPTPPLGTQELPFKPTPPASTTKPKQTVARFVGSTKLKLDKQPASPQKDETDNIDSESVPVRAKTPFETFRAKSSNVETGDFDTMLSYMDATVVSAWLTKSNKNVSEIAAYIAADDHFVQFAHFWLTDFPDIQKREIFELEIEILREELGFAFAPGRDDGKVSQRDISNLIGAIFREYPVKLLSGKGSFLFLDYLDTFTSGRTEKYKQLLSDVKCSTKNKQYAQWLLATRSYALVSMWCAIVNFYRNLLGRQGTVPSKVPDTPSTFKCVYKKRLFQALRRGYTDVIHFLNVGQQVDLLFVDQHERTLIFTAVMHNQPRVLQYLTTRVGLVYS